MHDARCCPAFPRLTRTTHALMLYWLLPSETPNHVSAAEMGDVKHVIAVHGDGEGS